MFDVLKAQKRRPAMKKISTMQVFGNEIFKEQKLTIGLDLSILIIATHFRRPPLCSELMEYRYKNMAGDRFLCSEVGNLPPGVKLTKAECAKLR
jgi:hypothetical protein